MVTYFMQSFVKYSTGFLQVICSIKVKLLGDIKCQFPKYVSLLIDIADLQNSVFAILNPQNNEGIICHHNQI